MKRKAILRPIAAAVLAILMGVCCVFQTVYARGLIDTHRETSLTLYFGQDGVGFSQVPFSVYAVAEVSPTGEYTLTGQFADYPVLLEDLDNSGWRALAQTLAAYAARDQLTPLAADETGADGRVSFSGLSTGLYLITGQQYRQGAACYTPEPTIVALPGLTDGEEWSYQAEISCKFDYEETPSQTVSRKVQKVWADGMDQTSRPEEIRVQLLKNGQVADTVTLNQQNNWEYTWENLDGSARWQVVEAQVPDGYTVTVTQEGMVFILTNTHPGKTPSTLPQTGMLWWPVPALACLGLLLIAAGVILRCKRGKHHER